VTHEISLFRTRNRQIYAYYFREAGTYWIWGTEVTVDADIYVTLETDSIMCHSGEFFRARWEPVTDPPSQPTNNAPTCWQRIEKEEPEA
jgi:hypothetical protein